jgi:hypothetical protein
MTAQHSSDIHLRTVFFSIPILRHGLITKYSTLLPDRRISEQLLDLTPVGRTKITTCFVRSSIGR